MTRAPRTDYKTDPDRKKPHPLDRAWAAGYIDGKGAFGKIRSNVIRIDTVDIAALKRLYEILGCGKLTELSRKTCSRPIWCYETTSMDNCRDVALLVLPFLSAERTKQASTMIARVERDPLWRKQNPEKAASCISVIAPKQDAEAQTPQPTTTQDG